jgi:acetoin utilization protein AcuB
MGSVLVARDVMSSPVATLPRDATIAQAWYFVQSREVRHVPIVDEGGTILGVISDRDLLRDAVSDAITDGSKPLSERLVRDLVSSRLLTAGPDTDISQIARVLCEEHVGSLPIIDEQQTLVGLVTRSDILKAIVEGGLLGK